jgi:hypothetical protein
LPESDTDPKRNGDLHPVGQRGDVSVVTMGANSATSFSMRDAKEFLAALQRPEFDELVRSLERDRPRKPGRDLDYYKARAYALRLHSQRR